MRSQENRSAGGWPCLSNWFLASVAIYKTKEGVCLNLPILRDQELSTPTGILLSVLVLVMGLLFRLNEVTNCCLFSRTPLHYAAANCHFHCIETLVTTGANVNETDDWGRTALHYAAASDMDRK